MMPTMNETPVQIRVLKQSRLQADLPAPRIDFRSTPDNRHSLADVGYRAILVYLSPSTGRAVAVAIRSKMTHHGSQSSICKEISRFAETVPVSVRLLRIYMIGTWAAAKMGRRHDAVATKSIKPDAV